MLESKTKKFIIYKIDAKTTKATIEKVVIEQEIRTKKQVLTIAKK
jgi:hypothetical protein